MRHDLPPRYYRKLPRLAAREYSGQARIHAMALELIRHGDGRLDADRLTRFVVAFQTVAPLSIGELWAWPSMLKLALIENLRRLAEGIQAGRTARLQADAALAALERGVSPGPLPVPLHSAFVAQLRHRMREHDQRVAPFHVLVEEALTDAGTTPEDVVRSEYQRQATDQASTGNTVTSLRLCATLDWSRYVERVSLVEQILRRDPAAVYPRMDFQSRDRYRQAVEELAEPTGEAQVSVALRAVESARSCVQGAVRGAPRPHGPRGPERKVSDGRETHVGYHLIGRGRLGLEIDVAWHPPPGQRLRRFVFAHATAAVPRWHRAVDGPLRRRRDRVREGHGGSRNGRRRGAAGADSRERARHAPRAAHRRGAGAAAPASSSRPRRRRARERPDDGRRPHASRERERRRASPGARRGPGAREPRSPRPLRDPERFPGREDGHDRRRRGDPGRRRRRSRGAEPQARSRDEGPVLSLPPRPPLEPEGRGLHGVGAQARKDRGVQPAPAQSRGRFVPCPGRGDVDPPVRAIRPHPGRRFASPEGRGRDPRRDPVPSAQPGARRPGLPAGDGRLRDPPAPGQRDADERRRFALREGLLRAHRRRPVLHGRLGHLPGPLRRRDLHGKGALRRRRLPGERRRSRPGERAPLARPVRGAPREDRARLRRGAGGRLPGQRPRPRAPSASLGEGRLADPPLALPDGPVAGGLQEEHPPAHQPVEDPRQPPEEPGRAVAPRPLRRGLDRPSGAAARLDPGRPRGRRVPAPGVPHADAARDPVGQAGAGPRPGRRRRPEHGLRAGAPDPRLSPVPRLGDGPRHRPDARPPGLHPAPAPRLGDRGRAGGAGHRGPEQGRPRLRRRDGGEPARGPGAAGADRNGPPGRLLRRPSLRRPLGGRPRGRLLAEPAHRLLPAGALAGGSRIPDPGREEDVAHLRDARSREITGSLPTTCRRGR